MLPRASKHRKVELGQRTWCSCVVDLRAALNIHMKIIKILLDMESLSPSVKLENMKLKKRKRMFFFFKDRVIVKLTTNI